MGTFRWWVAGLAALAQLALACNGSAALTPTAAPADTLAPPGAVSPPSVEGPTNALAPLAPLTTQPLAQVTPPVDRAPAPTPTAQPTPSQLPAPASTPTQPAAPAAPTRLLLGLSNPTSPHFPYVNDLPRLLNEKAPDPSIVAVETTSTLDSLRRLKRGELQFAQTTEDQRFLAVHGLDRWKDQPIPNARLLWIYAFTPCPLLARESSRVENLDDLNDQAVHPGSRGSVTEENTKKLLETLRLRPQWFVGLEDDAIGAFHDGRVTALARCLSASSQDAAALADLRATTPFRVLALSSEHVTKVQQQLPWLSVGEVPARYFDADWNRQALPTIGLVGDVAALAELPDDLAYRYTKAAIEDARTRGVPSRGVAAAQPTDLANLTVSLSSSPIHAGALRYYRELGLRIKESQIPPEVKR